MTQLRPSSEYFTGYGIVSDCHADFSYKGLTDANAGNIPNNLTGTTILCSAVTDAIDGDTCR